MSSNPASRTNVQRDLDSDLAAYSAASQAAIGRHGEEVRKRGPALALYTGAAGAALTGAFTAEAAIHYSGVQNITMSAGHATDYINLDGAGGNDFKLRWYVYGATVDWRIATVIGQTAGADVAMDGESGMGADYAKNFGTNDAISGGQATAWPGKAGFWFRTDIASWYGHFDAAPGYIGVRFDSGGTKYGWIHVDSVDGNLASYHVDGWAYEDSGGAIDADDTGGPAVVPEPSTIALALLASGAAGVMASRRRKILKGRGQPSETRAQ